MFSLDEILNIWFKYSTSLLFSFRVNSEFKIVKMDRFVRIKLTAVEIKLDCLT